MIASLLLAASLHAAPAPTPAPAVAPAPAQPTDAERIAALEARVAELEKLTAPLQEQARAEAQLSAAKAKFAARMEQDRKTFSETQLHKIEQTYAEGHDYLVDGSGKKALEKVVREYPTSDRAGCALLYLAQRARGAEAEDLLRKAIDLHGDCFYGDGVQVGAYARYLLAWHAARGGREGDALRLADEVRAQFPGAVNHDGVLLADHLPGSTMGD